MVYLIMFDRNVQDSISKPLDFKLLGNHHIELNQYHFLIMHCNLSQSLTVAVYTLLSLQHPDLPPIKKIFYNEHPSVANMEEEEVAKFRYVQE